MVKRFRIVIDVITEKPLAFQIFSQNEGIIHRYTKRGRVELYRIQNVHLEKAIIEQAELIEARTVG